MRTFPVVVAAVWLAFSGCNGSALDWRDSVSRKVARGNERFAQGQWSDALNAYRDAQIDAPAAPPVHFDIGDALYAQRKYEEAEASFSAAQAQGDRDLRAKAAYNLGNSQFRRNKFDKAAESFQRALELNPEDRDAKFNLELVQRLLNEAAQKAAEKKANDARRPQASEWARQRAHQAEALAQQGRYAEADVLMRRTLEAEPAAASEFGEFAQRLADLARIFGGLR